MHILSVLFGVKLGYRCADPNTRHMLSYWKTALGERSQNSCGSRKSTPGTYTIFHNLSVPVRISYTYFHFEFRILGLYVLFDLLSHRFNGVLVAESSLKILQWPSWSASYVTPKFTTLFTRDVLVPNLNQTNPLHTLPSYRFNINFNVLPSTARSSEWPLPFRW
jgi:hypothetical protein